MTASAQKKYTEVTRRLPRPIVLHRQEEEGILLPGGCLFGIHFERFMDLDPREKLLLIRIWLEEMYGEDEFSRPAVVKKVKDGLSYQGLKNIEELLKNSVRESNVSRLSEVYSVPKEFISNRLSDEFQPKGLFIGKVEDMHLYFYHYYNQHGKNHILDDTDYSQFFWDEHTKGLKEVDLEIYIKVREPETGEPITTRNIARLKLLADDLPKLHEILVKDVEVIAAKHDEFIGMREHIQELYQRLSAAERLIDLYEGVDPNEQIKKMIEQFENN